jgi:GNAT superfamily N-acetyltransferase
MDKITHRIATENDIELLADLRIAFSRETGSSDAVHAESETRDSILRYIHRHIQCGDYIGYLTYCNDVIAATAAVLIYELPPLLGSPDRTQAHMLNMFTVKEYRRRGIGRSLLDFVIRDCLSKEITRLYLNALPGSEKMYLDAGFRDNPYRSMILSAA